MGRVQLNVWVSEAERAGIKRLAAERELPVGRLVVEAVFGIAENPETLRATRAAAAADEALERIAGVESSVESLEGRLGRLESLAQGASY